jgi:hypothetical protein
MTFYQELISEAIGVSDLKVIDEVEDLMRNVIFHSALNWQSREQLVQGAIEAKQVLDLM